MDNQMSITSPSSLSSTSPPPPPPPSQPNSSTVYISPTSPPSSSNIIPSPTSSSMSTPSPTYNNHGLHGGILSASSSPNLGGMASTSPILSPVLLSSPLPLGSPSLSFGSGWRQWTSETLSKNQRFHNLVYYRLGNLKYLSDSLAEPEPWGKELKILKIYLDNTFKRVVEENKMIAYFPSETSIQPILLLFNTGLLSKAQEEIYCILQSISVASARDREQESGGRRCEERQWILKEFLPWSLMSDQSVFDKYNSRAVPYDILPERAYYYIDGIEHATFDPLIPIDRDNVDFSAIIKNSSQSKIDRLPQEYVFCSDKELLSRFNSGISAAITRARANPRCAVPQFHRDNDGLKKIDLLLPINMSIKKEPDCSLVVRLVVNSESKFKSYQVRGILSKEDSYINARVIQKIDQKWLEYSELNETNTSTSSTTSPFPSPSLNPVGGSNTNNNINNIQINNISQSGSSSLPNSPNPNLNNNNNSSNSSNHNHHHHHHQQQQQQHHNHHHHSQLKSNLNKKKSDQLNHHHHHHQSNNNSNSGKSSPYNGSSNHNHSGSNNHQKNNNSNYSPSLHSSTTGTTANTAPAATPSGNQYQPTSPPLPTTPPLTYQLSLSNQNGNNSNSSNNGNNSTGGPSPLPISPIMFSQQAPPLNLSSPSIQPLDISSMSYSPPNANANNCNINQNGNSNTNTTNNNTTENIIVINQINKSLKGIHYISPLAHTAIPTNQQQPNYNNGNNNNQQSPTSPPLTSSSPPIPVNQSQQPILSKSSPQLTAHHHQQQHNNHGQYHNHQQQQQHHHHHHSKSTSSLHQPSHQSNGDVYQPSTTPPPTPAPHMIESHIGMPQMDTTNLHNQQIYNTLFERGAPFDSRRIPSPTNNGQQHQSQPSHSSSTNQPPPSSIYSSTPNTPTPLHPFHHSGALSPPFGINVPPHSQLYSKLHLHTGPQNQHFLNNQKQHSPNQQPPPPPSSAQLRTNDKKQHHHQQPQQQQYHHSIDHLN